MNIHRGIVTASLAIPTLLFFCFLTLSAYFLINGEEFWRGAIMGGVLYTLIAFCITFPSTYIFGYPLCKVAIKNNYTSIWFATLTGCFSGAISFSITTIFFDVDIPSEIFHFICLGAVGGLINGLIIWYLVIQQPASGSYKDNDVQE